MTAVRSRTPRTAKMLVIAGAVMTFSAAVVACGASEPQTTVTTAPPGTFPDKAAAEKFAALVATTFQEESASSKTAYGDLDFTAVIHQHADEIGHGDGTFEDMVAGRSLTVDDQGCTVTIEFEPTEVGTAPKVDDADCD